MGFFSDLKEDLSQAVNELNKEIDVNGEGALEKEDKTVGKATGGPKLSVAEMLNNMDAFEEEADDGTDDSDEALPEGQKAGSILEELQEEQLTESQSYDEVKNAEEEMETAPVRVAVDETSVISEAMLVTGDIVTEGSVSLIGAVNGNITALGKLNITGHINGNSKAAEIYAEGARIVGEIVSEGAVKIGVSSMVIGNITATSAAIAGAVKGDIDVHGPVILDSSAIVMGNIKSKSVQINNGAVVEGMCSQCYADVNPATFFDEFKPVTDRS